MAVVILIAATKSIVDGQVIKILPPHTVGDGGPALDAEIDGPVSVAVDSFGNVYVYQSAEDWEGLRHIGTVLGAIRRIDSSTHRIDTVATECGRHSARTRRPGCIGAISELHAAPSGEVLFSEFLYNRLRALDPRGHRFSTIAGSGSDESSGDGGTALLAGVGAPMGLTVDSRGNIFLSDSKRYVRRVDATTRIISTVAGNGRVGSGGDGGPALAAQIDARRLVVDRAGDLFIGEDATGWIRRVDAATGIIETIAGGGPLGSCQITRFCGDGGLATAAHIYDVRSLALDRMGNVLFAPGGRVCRIDRRSGIVTTIAGTGEKGFSGDGGPAAKARVDPVSIAVDRAGNLFIADYGNNRIRRVDAETGVITTIGGNGLPRRQPVPSL